MKKLFTPAFSLLLILVLAVSFLPQAQPAYAVSTGIVISQVYGGGGNFGATFKNDFIELYNLGSSSVDISNWSVQYASAAGSSWQVTPLCPAGTCGIDPGKYYLVQESAGSGGTTGLPAPDAAGGIAMSATAGKVALASNTTALTGTCPLGGTIIDFVGYGTTANCSETSPTATLSNTTAALRKANGATDTDNNSADFTVGAPNPRNSQFPNPSGVGSTSPATLLSPGDNVLLLVAVTPGQSPSSGFSVTCDLSAIGGPAGQPLYDNGTNGDVTANDNTFSFGTTVVAVSGSSIPCTVSDSQGKSGTATIPLSVILPIGVVNGAVGDTGDATQHTSPYVGRTVSIQGVIYEKTLQASSGSPYNGFFLQNTSATADTDPNTSDGLFVFIGNFNTLIDTGEGAYAPQVGDEVVLSGRVTEFFNMTELSSATLVKPVIRSGVDIDAEVAPVVADPPVSLADANRYWERLQGMRVQAPVDSIVLGGRNVFSPADGEVWLARPDSPIALRADPYARRAFRDAHPLDDNFDPANWDGNGYRMLLGSLGIKATLGDAQALINPARTFDTLTNAPSGGINYSFSKYRIEVSDQPVFSEGVDPSQNNPPQAVDRSTGYSIVDYNLENLYDYRDNPFSGCDFANVPAGSNAGCPNAGTPFLAPINPPYDYVPADDAAYQARLTDIANQIINDLHSPDVMMVQEVENQDICSVAGAALTCGSADNADGKPDVLQDLALKVVSLGGPAYDAAFDRDSSDLRGIAPSFLYRTDRVQLLPAAGDPILGADPAISGYTSVPYDADVSNPKTLNALLPAGVAACETSWVFPRAPDVGLFRIFTDAVGGANYRDVYVIDNHFKSGPDTCVDHRKEQAKYNAALVAYLQAANPSAHIVDGGDLNVYPRPDDPFAPIGQPGSSDQLGALYDPGLGLKNLWEVLLDQAPEAAYSYVFVGQAQTLDQMFVNPPMLADLQQFRSAHINSDFPADYSGDVARGTSDHDPNVANFTFDVAPVVSAPTVSPESSTEGVSVTASADFSDPDGSADGPFTCTVNYGDGSGDLAGSVAGSTCTGPSHAYSTFGAYTVTVSVTDKFGATGSNTALHDVNFNFTGFFPPVSNPPAMNTRNSGSAVPVQFSLGGNKGLNILAAGYPKSTKVACDTLAPLSPSQPTASSSGLSYNAQTQTYTYVWKTEKAWKNSCRQLSVQLVDGTTWLANFNFNK